MTESHRVEMMLGKNPAVLSIRAEAAVLMAAKKMRHHHVGCLIVIDDAGAPVGVITERDLVEKVLVGAKEPERVQVKEVMTDKLISVTTRTSIMRAQAIMAKHKIRHLPIIEDGLMLGMISSRDIVAHQLGAVRSILEQQARLCRDLVLCTEEAEQPEMPL